MTAFTFQDAAAGLERKKTAAPVARVASDGAFEGYASLFGVVDLAKDVVLRGAFRASLAARGPRGIKLLWQHDPAEPLGVWTSLAEDHKGLLARGRLNLAVARAREIHALMRDGAIDGLSIGFKTIKARTEPRSAVRRLEAVDLWEISLVTFPLLPQARVSAVKAGPVASRGPGLGLRPARLSPRAAAEALFTRSPSGA
jgi:HK97 family phage prohead protease